jgi:hypothetical protein
MAHQRAKAGNTEFLMVVPPGGVRRVLELRRLDTVLATCPRLGITLLAGDRKPA